jgi:O-antigen ligase
MEKNLSSRFIEALFLVYFLTLPFVFFKEISDPFLLARQLFTNVFLMVVLLAIVVKKKPFLFAFTTPSYCFFGFILIGLLSFSTSAISSNSHFIFSRYVSYFTYFILLTGLLYNERITIDKLKKFLIYFGVISLSIAMLSILNKTIKGQNLFRQVDLVSGTFANKNLLSSLLFCCLPFYFLGFSLSKKMKAVSVSAIILTVFVLLILRTRTVLISTVIFLFLSLYYELKQRIFSIRKFRILFSAAVLSIIVFCSYLFLAKDTFHSSPDINIQYFYRLLDTRTLDSRTLFWENSFKMIGGNFWTGVGLGNWIVEFPHYSLNHFTEYGIVNGTTIVTNPHNDFLLVFAETGIFGILCYLGLFATLLYQCLFLMRNAKSQSDKRMFYCLLSFVVGYLFIAFFDFPLDRIEHQILLLTVFGISNSYYLKFKNTTNNSSKLPLFFFGIITLYSSTVIWYRINGENHVFRMLEAKKNSDWQNVIWESNLAQNYFYEMDTKSIPLEWYKATALFKLNQMQESNKSFLTAHRLNPNNISILNDLGSSFTNLNQQEKAIEFYKKALQISDNYENARLNLAAVYFNKKEYENAFQAIDQCDINSTNVTYALFLTPILEKKLNTLLEDIKNSDLNSYLQQKIKTQNDLIELYFASKKNNCTFEKYIQSLSNSL